jgi:uncharacterized protein YjiK
MTRHGEGARRHRGTPGRAALLVAATLALPITVADAAAQAGRPPCILDSIAWAEPHRFALPGGLREVSGLAVLADGRLLAHDDERGLVSLLDARSGKRVAQFTLGPRMPRDDFEGIALLGERLFLSTSGGRLYETSVGRDGDALPFRVQDTGLGPLCELEGLAADRATGSLLLSCKEPHTSELRGQVVIFTWSPDGGGLEDVRFRAPQATFHAEKVNGFRPSAVDVLPGGDLLVLSGADRAIAQVTPPGIVRCVRRLDARHRQAEGLALLPGGGLAIADEGDPSHLTIYGRRTR